MTVFGGFRKSAREEPSRRNSGFTAMPKSFPATAPDARSSAGITSSSVVPGITVERITTVWRSAVSAIPCPMISATRSSALVSRLPFPRNEGVPTQTSESSVSATAAAPSSVERRRPSATTPLDQLAQTRLEHRDASVADELDLPGIDVDADDLVPRVGERRGRHAADVAEPEDRDSHATAAAAETAALRGHSRRSLDNHVDTIVTRRPPKRSSPSVGSAVPFDAVCPLRLAVRGR